MIPIYTRVLTTSEFGQCDLILSTVSLLVPLLTLSIAQGILRFSMDKEIEIGPVFTFGLRILAGGLGFLLLLSPLIRRIDIFNTHLSLFLLAYITSAMQNYLNMFARGINKIKLVGACGIISSVIIVVSNTLLLVVFRSGVSGYLFSFISAFTCSSIILFIGGRMHRFVTLAPCPARIKKQFVTYSLPFTPNSTSWWLNSTANRFIISGWCGVSAVGLFSAAARIPAVINALNGIFYHAWQLSAISEYDKHDKAHFFSKAYRTYDLVLVGTCSLLISCTKLVAGIMFSESFFVAWQFTPLLLIASLFGALSGFLESIYAASMQTAMLYITTLVGGIAAICINLALIPVLGPFGASVSSVLSYFSIWALRLFNTRQYVKLKLDLFKDCQCYLLLVIQAVTLVYMHTGFAYVVQLTAIILIAYLKLEDIAAIIQIVVRFSRSLKREQASSD